MATTSTSALSAAEQASLVESSKRAAAYEAVKEHMDLTYTHVGIGSGSTVIYVVEAIAALGHETTSRMAFFPTGEQSRELIRGAGLNLQYVQDLPEGKQLDVCFDGADEVDEELNLIKGGGACLFQEKLIVTKAKKFVCVAGEWGGPFSPPPPMICSTEDELTHYARRLQENVRQAGDELEEGYPDRGRLPGRRACAVRAQEAGLNRPRSALRAAGQGRFDSD